MSNIYRCVTPIPQIHHKFIDYKDAGQARAAPALSPYAPEGFARRSGERGTCPPTMFARGEAGGKTC